MQDVTPGCLPDSVFEIACEMPRRKKEDCSFGPRLTAVRKARGLSQVQLAQAGSTRRSISYYANNDAETQRPRERFPMVTELLEEDQRAIIRLINSLAAVGAVRKNGSMGERNGR
jgi:hypothetical protein